MISNLQSQLSNLKGQYGSLQSYIAKTKSPATPTPEPMSKLQKPPPKQATDPEIIDFKGFTWLLLQWFLEPHSCHSRTCCRHW
jgi:hypothetical protein